MFCEEEMGRILSAKCFSILRKTQIDYNQGELEGRSDQGFEAVKPVKKGRLRLHTPPRIGSESSTHTPIVIRPG